MTDHPNSQKQNDDETLARLFRERLKLEPLPVGAAEHLVQRVLMEVNEVYPTPVPRQEPKKNWLERLRGWAGSLRPAQSLALASAGALVIMLLFVGIARLSPRPLSAVTTVAGDDATVLRAHNGSYRKYLDGDVLKVQQGDQILTESGEATATFFANQFAEIGPNAHVELARLDDADGGTQVELIVHDGAVRSDIGEQLSDNDRYIVSAPGIEVRAHGTTFTVSVISEAETLVTTLQGEVEVQMGDQVVEVGSGEEVDAVIGEALLVTRADGETSGGPTPILVVTEATGGLQLFTAPQASAARLGKVATGRTFQIEEQDSTGQWYRVCCVNGKSGWVRIPEAKPAE